MNSFRLSFLAASFFSLLSGNAFASIDLKEVKIESKSRVVFDFDHKLNKEQVTLDIFRDVIQFSITDAKVFPAKIQAIGDQDLLKVFAYQYTPKLMRCRLTTNGDVAKFKDRIDWKIDGGKLIVSLKEKLTAQPKSTSFFESAESKDEVKTTSAAPEKSAASEKTQKASAEKSPSAIEKNQLTGNSAVAGTLTAGKPLPSPIKSFAWLGVMLAGILGLAALVRKYKGKTIGKLFTKEKKMIEMIANYSLGPKKSVAVMKIKGQLLVVGVCDESINLITKLNDESELDSFEFNLESSSKNSFEEITKKAVKPLKSYAAPKNSFSDEDSFMNSPAPTVSQKTGVRDQIRDRMKGMKSI